MNCSEFSLLLNFVVDKLQIVAAVQILKLLLVLFL